MNKTDNIVNYILSFLLYGQDPQGKIGYTNDPALFDQYQLIILPNGHLGKDWIIPCLSHPTRQGKFITTDIVYTTAFFISRAEELINTQRDRHGRFLAQYSILGQQNRLHIPIIDEYSRFLIKALKQTCETNEININITLPTTSFSHIYLTHDIDTIANHRHLRGVLGGIARGQIKQVLHSLQNIKNDPAFTFPQLLQHDQPLLAQHNCNAIYFVKQTNGKGYDYPQYPLNGKDYLSLQQQLIRSGAQMGIHSSYYPSCPISTNNHNRPIYHRSHYLCCNIQRMQYLADIGITDDFTMGFPDQAGFRLQTTRPVQWINPHTFQLTSLTLHPLTVMDVTLSQYMHLDEAEAYYLCEQLFDKIYHNAGEIVLLWHNTSLTHSSYHTTLYPALLQLLNNYETTR